MSNIIIHERPGVYSSYDASTVIRGGRAVRVIGVAAKATAGTPNVPVTLTSYEGGLSAFGEDAEGTPGMAAILSFCSRTVRPPWWPLPWRRRTILPPLPH